LSKLFPVQVSAETVPAFPVNAGAEFVPAGVKLTVPFVPAGVKLAVAFVGTPAGQATVPAAVSVCV
jgi:hypothetical protein